PTLLSPSACSLHVSTSPEIFALSLHDALPICASTWLGRRLTKHGYGRFYKVGPGPNYTKTDQRALVRFKRKHGFGKSGAMTRATWKALNRRAGHARPPKYWRKHVPPKGTFWVGNHHTAV